MWGDFWTTFGAVGLALLCACTALNVIAAVVLARKSLPRLLKLRLDETSEVATIASKKVESIEAQVASWKAELQGLVDEAQSWFERTERKRAAAAAAASRAERARGETGDGIVLEGGTREQRMAQIRAVARQRGIG